MRFYKVKEPQIGMKFASFDEVQKFVKEYSDAVNQTFVIRSSNEPGPNCRIKKTLKHGIKYHNIKYVCKRGNRFHAQLKSKLRQKRSVKVGCPAYIRLKASSNGCYLEISQLNLEHANHLTNELDPTPEARRLQNEEQYKFVTDAISMKCNRPCLIQTLQERFGLCIYSKDLKNIQAKLKSLAKKSDEVSSVIEILQNKDCRIDVLREGDMFQGIFFTTPDMVTSTKAWGETVFFDGTYKLVLHSLVVVLFLVEDCNFLTEISAVAIVRREDQATWSWILQCYRKHHPDLITKNKYFMSDKSAVERNAVDEFFPNTQKLICFFHTCQIFKRQTQKMNISTDEKKIALEKLKQIACAETDETYDCLLNQIKIECPKCVTDYFFENWHDIKSEWTCYQKHEGTFYNRTNNRSESLNQKLKQVIDKLSSFLETVTKFFTWKNFHDQENQVQIVRNFASTIKHNCDIEKLYFDLLMYNPFKIVKMELNSKDYITFDVTDKNTGTFTIRASNRVGTVEKCNCKISKCYLLPCRHIFAVRKILNMPLYKEELCAERWTKKLCQKYHRVFLNNKSNISKSECVTYTHKTHKVTSKKELRKIHVNEVLSDLIDVCSCSCGYGYYEKVLILLQLSNVWQKNLSVIITEVKKMEDRSLMELKTIKSSIYELNKSINTKDGLDVPQKRKQLEIILEDFGVITNEKELYNIKLSTLKKLREYWIEGKLIKLVENESIVTEIAKKIKSNCSNIVLPSKPNLKGKPKFNLVTNDKYRRKITEKKMKKKS